MSRRFDLTTTAIAGTRYYVSDRSVKAIRQSAPITFVPEPDNESDPVSAVACFCDGLKLGYVPRAISGIVRGLIAAGVDLRGVVEDVYDDKTVIMRIYLRRATKIARNAQD